MWSLPELLNQIGESYAQMGSYKEAEFENIRTPEDAGSRDLTFITGSNPLSRINKTRAAVVISSLDGEGYTLFAGMSDKAIFKVLRPKLVVAKLLEIVYGDSDEPSLSSFGAKYFTHETASVDPEADIHPFVYIGPRCIIGKCVIGEHTIIDANTIIKDNVEIGEHVRIREFCLIGGTGFGYIWNDDGSLRLFPHVGKVVIEDYVDIFPYVNIDRGGLGETRIKRGAKIDRFCHVSHNTTVGSNTQLTAGTILCGGSSIGDNCFAGVGSMVRQKIKVGNKVTLGMGAVVVKDVPDGITVTGVPAKEMKK